MTERSESERAELVACREQLMAQTDYSVDLQIIIEDLCHDRPIRKPQTDARHHYEMAVAYRLAAQDQKPCDGCDGHECLDENQQYQCQYPRAAQALDPMEMLLDAARYAEGNGGKYRNPAWSKAARAAVAKARLSQPAPVAANASAEARLREALQYALDYGYMKNDEAWKKCRAALSAHPHASDCDRFQHFAPDGGKAPIRPDAPDHLTVKTSAELAHASDCDKQGER